MNGTNGMSFTTEWPSSDYEMMQQSIDDYVNNDRFHAYYMTFSGHGPYSTANPIAVTKSRYTVSLDVMNENFYKFALESLNNQ